jgi:hypothetical protein
MDLGMKYISFARVAKGKVIKILAISEGIGLSFHSGRLKTIFSGR